MEQFGAGFDTITADVYTGSGDHPGFMLPLAAETANDRLFFGFSHGLVPPFGD